MKRTILFLVAVTTAVSCLFAQATKNPFSELGYKKQVMYTSSKGEFEEFHENPDVVEIGSVYFNTKANKVVGYVNPEKEKAEVATATSAMSVDPLCEKYYWISPYAYCLNNPVKYVDPDGKDVAILIAKDGAGGYGHMAAVIQDKNGKFYYMTVGNAEDGAGLSKMATTGTRGGMYLEPLDAKNMKEAIGLAKQDGSNSTYTDQVVLKTSSKMDNAIFKTAASEKESINSGKEKYNVLSNNCADVVVKVVENGTKVDLKEGSSPKPNTQFENIKENAKETQKEIDKNRPK